MAAADDEEEYIEMDMSSAGTSRSSAFLCYSILSPLPPTSTHSNEFEFQMSAVPAEAGAAASPADEIFYQGKLLPLHLPPRLQMVEKLLQNSKEQPLEACKEDCCSECSAALVMSRPRPKSASWSKKFNLIKQLSLSTKLKASRHYLMSLFYSRPRADEPYASEKITENLYASGQSSIRKGKPTEEEVACHRNSFSGAINWSLVKKNSSLSSSSSSSSSSFSATSSNRFSQSLLLNRSSSVDSDAESSIQGAITHCKKSQQMISGRKSASDFES